MDSDNRSLTRKSLPTLTQRDAVLRWQLKLELRARKEGHSLIQSTGATDLHYGKNVYLPSDRGRLGLDYHAARAPHRHPGHEGQLTAMDPMQPALADTMPQQVDCPSVRVIQLLESWIGPTATGPRPRAFNLCCSYFLCNDRDNSRFNLATVHLAYTITRLPLLPNLVLCSRRPNLLHNPSIIASPACLLSFVLPTRYFRLLYTIHAPCLGSTLLAQALITVTHPSHVPTSHAWFACL